MEYMRKITATILSILCLAATGVSSVAGLGAQNPPVATAAEGNANGYPEAMYETRHTAATEGYTATSLGDTLYLFNHDGGGVWQEHIHHAPITQMHFGEGSDLYFLDADSNLYRLDTATLDSDSTATELGLHCDAFTIVGERMYCANIGAGQTSFYEAPLSDLSASSTPFLLKAYSPALSVWNDRLYAVDGSSKLHRISLTEGSSTEVAKLPEGTVSMTIAEGRVFGVTSEGNFYGYNLAELSEKTSYATCAPVAEKGAECEGISAYNGKVYLYQTTGDATQAHAYSITEGEWQIPEEFTRPTVRNIPTGKLATELAAGSTEFSIVQTSESALLVAVELSGIQDDSVFPYLSAKRTGQSVTAVQIATTVGYALLAHRESPTDGYQTYVVSTTGITDVSNEKILNYATPKTGYTTNKVHLYEYPHLGLATMSQQTKGAELVLLGEVQGLDIPYYAVKQGENVGYIPQSYVTPFHPNPTPAETVTLGSTKKEKDSIWRFAYILLGTAAIGILADFLILRKKSDD